MTDRRVIPKIRLVDGELPQWILSSHVAAYHPATQTIWISRCGPWTFGARFGHELIHHGIHLVGGGARFHHAYDAIWLTLFGRAR